MLLQWILVTLVALLVVAAICGALVWRTLRRAMRESELARARQEFHRQRERLEARFFQLASGSGKPRGLRWTDCDFTNEVTYARHRRTAELCAFVAVTIYFEAIEGGPMEGVEAVSNPRAATSVFRYRNTRWETDGWAVFNLNPTEAIAYYHDNLELVGIKPVQKAPTQKA